MRKAVVKILWLAGIGALLYGGFVAYERWWDGDVLAIKERVFSFVSDRAETATEKAAKAGSKVLERAKEEAAEAAKSTIATAVGGAVESLGERIASFGESIAGPATAAPVPAATGMSFQIPPPPISLTARVGVPLTFAVNEGEKYAAAWGDGAADEGVKEKTTTVILRHEWNAPGDYTVILTTRKNGVSHTETFPVRIYAP